MRGVRRGIEEEEKREGGGEDTSACVPPPHKLRMVRVGGGAGLGFLHVRIIALEL